MAGFAEIFDADPVFGFHAIFSKSLAGAEHPIVAGASVPPYRPRWALWKLRCRSPVGASSVPVSQPVPA